MRYAALLFVLSLTAVPASAQLGGSIGLATDHVRWEASVAPDSVRPGNGLKVVLDAYIARPWKMYALDETIPDVVGGRPFGVKTQWQLPDGFAMDGPAEQSTPKEGYDEQFELTVQWYYDRARFVYTVGTAADTPAGDHEISGTVTFQICEDERGICLPPTGVEFATSVVVDPTCTVKEGDVDVECGGDQAGVDELFAELGIAVGASDEAPAAASSSRGPMEAAGSGFLGFLLLAVGAGLASLLTPCVFPMIPLTVSYFTKHADDRAKAVKMAWVFGASIVLLFTVLGILLAVAVGAAGAQTIAANPWVNLFIAGVLVVFALALLGLYELRVPNALLNFSNRQSNQQSGYLGVLFMGLTLTLVSFSCTAPFVGGLLAAAAGGSWLYPIGGMLGFSMAFASPFVLLAIFPNALASLPKAGGWMNSFKVVLGFVELAAAIKFISNADLVWAWGLVSRPLAIAVTIVIFLVTGAYLLGKIRLRHDSPSETIGVGRLMASIGFIAVALYMIPGLLGAPLNALDAYLPPRQGTDISLLSQSAIERAGLDDELWFVDDLEGAMAEGRTEGRPVFVDFTGYTCTNCRDMEANVFPRPSVRTRFDEQFVLLRLYTDGLERGPDFQRYQLGLTGTVALPTYAVVDPATERLVHGASGLMKEDRFVEFLDRGYNQWASESSLASR